MKQIKILVTAIVMSLTLFACGDPDVHTEDNPKYQDIKSNETVYVIPLVGKSKSSQGKFGSAAFLEEKKVATKRIQIPRAKLSTGRMPWSYKWLPEVKVITVDRSPIMFEWESEDLCISVESRDSIGFCVGINIAAEIKEEDTSAFLYSFPAGNLALTLNKAVRARATESLSNHFAMYDLEGSPAVLDKNGKVITEEVEGARQQKGLVVAKTKAELVKYFKTKGVTITSFGLVGGLSYDDKDIQEAINKNFKSELQIKNAINERLEQDEINKKNVSIATAEKDAATEFAKASKARTAQVELEIRKMDAQANLNRSTKWDGALPKDMMMLPADADPGFILTK